MLGKHTANLRVVACSFAKKAYATMQALLFLFMIISMQMFSIPNNQQIIQKSTSQHRAERMNLN